MYDGPQHKRRMAKVASMDIHGVFIVSLKLVFLGLVAVYVGSVLIHYLTHGPRPRPRFDWHDPAHSAERLAIWLGAKGFAVAVIAAVRIFEMLSEASAEVGDWFLSLSHRHGAGS
jgi:hypothetical protein